jgi:hypothetical protein
MARLSASGEGRPEKRLRLGGPAAIAAIAFVLLGACQQALSVKTEVVKKVDAALLWNSLEWHGTRTVVGAAAYAAKIGFNGDSLYVLYFDSVPKKLMLVKSPDRGLSWGSPYVVDGTTGFYTASNSMVVDGSNLYIAYQRVDSDFFIQVTDNGSSFSSSNAKTISTAPVSYPYGYENSITCDAQNVYIAYSAGGGPAFTYAAKGASMTFSTPALIDSAIGTASGNRKRTSILIDSNGNVNVSYFDAFGSNQLKNAVFAPTASLPQSVGGLSTATITSAESPSAAAPNLISFYDPTAKSYRLYERYSYVSGLNLFFKSNATTIDASSPDVGQSGVLIYQGTALYAAYYDAANKNLKFAVGSQPSPSQDYAFTSKVLAAVGGVNFDCSFVADQANGTFYVLYYDSTGSGALKLAKSTDDGATW